jgi:hypothetical protein
MAEFAPQTGLGSRRVLRLVHEPLNLTCRVARANDRYLDLVRKCSLRVIRSEEEYDHAIAVLNQLSDRGRHRTSDETEYLLAKRDNLFAAATVVRPSKDVAY